MNKPTMKCILCGSEYMLDGDDLYWVCVGCCDELSKPAYEQIAAMQAVIATIPRDAEGNLMQHGAQIYFYGKRSKDAAWNSIPAQLQTTWMWASLRANDGFDYIYPDGFTMQRSDKCYLRREAAEWGNCTTPQPCGVCKKCKGSEANHG